jgi:hypothetical protein
MSQMLQNIKKFIKLCRKSGKRLKYSEKPQFVKHRTKEVNHSFYTFYHIALTYCIVTISENSFFAKFIIDRTSVAAPEPGQGIFSG